MTQHLQVIGLLGGMSWESTREYYRLINEGVKYRLGNLHSARIIMYSYNFAEIAELQEFEDWENLGNLLAEGAGKLQEGGAEIVLICSNTMHKVADRVRDVLEVPFLDIIDVIAGALRAEGVRKAGLVGTKFTMQDGFYQQHLSRFHIDCITPDTKDMDTIHDIIYNELCKGLFTPASRKKFSEVYKRLADKGAEGIILGCTEIGLLLQSGDAPVPVFDSTILHAEAAVNRCLLDATLLQKIL